jgi:hypothetical protein
MLVMSVYLSQGLDMVLYKLRMRKQVNPCVMVTVMVTVTAIEYMSILGPHQP